MSRDEWYVAAHTVNNYSLATIFCFNHIPIRWVRPMAHATHYFDILHFKRFELSVAGCVKFELLRSDIEHQISVFSAISYQNFLDENWGGFKIATDPTCVWDVETELHRNLNRGNVCFGLPNELLRQEQIIDKDMRPETTKHFHRKNIFIFCKLFLNDLFCIIAYSIRYVIYCFNQNENTIWH